MHQCHDKLSTDGKHFGCLHHADIFFLSFKISMLCLCCIFQAQTTVLPNGLMQDEFEKTSVNMSTYLVAFIVAEFTSLSQNVSDTLVCPTQI